MQNTKSVIDIEVNDDQFKQFHELFLKYQKVLGQSPQLWKDVEKGIDRATNAVDKQTDAVDKGTDAVDRQTDAIDKQTDAIDRQTDKRKQEDKRREDALDLEGRKIDENAQKQEQADTAHLGNMRELAAALMAHHEMMLDIAREEKRQNEMRDEAAKKQERDEKRINDLHKERVKTVKDFARTLGSLIGSTASIGLNIAKWGLGLGVGLIGGGFFGMDRLGAGATGERSRARGLGVSAGELRAWQTDVGSYIDPSGLLGAASNAYADPNQRALFQRAGVGADVIRSGNTSQISEQALRGLISFYNQNQGPNAAQSWSARGFDQLVSFGDIRRIAAAPERERERMFGALQRDTRNLNTSDRTMSAWQDFYTQLQRSGTLLKNTFLDGLVRLTGPMKELSGAAVDLVREFMQGGGFQDVINILKTGLTDLTDSMKDGTFKKAVTDISNSLKELYDSGAFSDTLKMIENGLKGLASILGLFAPSDSSLGKKDSQRYDHWKSGAVMGGVMGATAGSVIPGIGTLAGGAMGAGLGVLSGGIYDFTRYLSSIAQTESSGNPNAVSHAGALGMFQLMPATAREYGVSDPFNPRQAAQGAGLYIQALNQMFQGDMLKTTAAYNAGQGRVQKAVQKYGGDWLSHMPTETQQYVGRVAANYRAGNFNVNIQNATGGAATVTAAMAGG